MGKNKKKNKSKPEGAPTPMAVGGLKITDTRTKVNKPQSGATNTPAASNAEASKPKSEGGVPPAITDGRTVKKIKIVDQCKPAREPADRQEASQTVETTKVAAEEPIANEQFPEEAGNEVPRETWDECNESAFNFPSTKDVSNEESAGQDKQNDNWFDQKGNNQTVSYSNATAPNKVHTSSSSSIETPDFGNKGAVHKEPQHRDSCGDRRGNNQVQGRDSQDQRNQRGSAKHQNWDSSSRDNHYDNQEENRSRESGNNSYRQRDSGKSREQNTGMGKHDASAWSQNANQKSNNANDSDRSSYQQQKTPREFENREYKSSRERGNSSHGGGESGKNWEHNTGIGSACPRNTSPKSNRASEREGSYYQHGGRPREFENREQKRERGSNSYRGVESEKHREQNTEIGNWNDDKSNRSNKSSQQHQESGRWEGGNREQNRKVDWGRYRSPNRNKEEEKDEAFNEFWKYFKSSREKEYVKVEEVEGDLFAVPKEYALAHCVAEDMAMGSGIAVQFSRDFKRRDELLQQRAKQGGLAFLEVGQRYIYYLVTKRLSTGKPTQHTLWRSLQEMQQHVQEHKVTQLAMPRIGCGLDRLEWAVVKPMIEFTFRKTDIQITICNFQQPDDGSLPPAPARSSKCAVQNVDYPLVQIDKFTAIVYFGSEDGFVTEEIQSLDTRFNILQDYTTAPNKRVGEVISSTRLQNTYILYGFIVKKSKDDLFNFIGLQKCITQFKKMNVKDKASEYVGIQAFCDDDDLLISKIVNILRYSLYGVEIYVCWPGKMAPLKPQDRRDNYY